MDPIGVRLENPLSRHNMVGLEWPGRTSALVIGLSQKDSRECRELSPQAQSDHYPHPHLRGGGF